MTEVIEMKKNNSFSVLIFIIILVIGLGLAYTMHGSVNMISLWSVISVILIAYIVSYSIQIADQWERAVILRLGKFLALKGPGLFFIIPIIDSVRYWIDIRVITEFFQGGKDPY